MKRFKKKILFAVRLCLLLFFIGFYGSITMFYHAHYVCGNVITHSHPYRHDPENKTPFPSHSHSSIAYNLIDQLNKIVFDGSSSAFFITENYSFCDKTINSYNSLFLFTFYLAAAQLRAPPAC
ncbi:MAG: hypothetical protein LLG13_01745 [Bacteroidales bacterium]|nr:hypothetical protein [Bacteroidales bacterium]